MEQIRKFHEHSLVERTHIRNHKSILQWMKKCWKLAPHANPARMTMTEYDELYSMLLCKMTICWEEELGDVILAKMRTRDMSSFSDLNFNRFFCSLFFFAEMWVETVTAEEYERIFCHVHLVLSGETSTMSLMNPTTLASFNTALDSIIDLEDSNLNIGKSISFDVRKYYLQFGAESIPQFAEQSNNVPLRYHDDERGDRLYKFTVDEAKDTAFQNLQRPASSALSRTCNGGTLQTWSINRQRSAHIISKSERKCSSSSASNCFVAFGEFTLKSYIQHPESISRSIKYRLHIDNN